MEWHVFHPLFKSINLDVAGEEGSWKSINMSEMIVTFGNLCIQDLGELLGRKQPKKKKNDVRSTFLGSNSRDFK